MKTMLTAALVAATAVAAVAAAPADLSSATVAVSGSTVTATVGAVELVDVATATDAVGDARGSGLGLDLTGSFVSFPGAGKIAINVAIGDANPATGTIPVGAQFAVAPTIGSTVIELIATAQPSGLVFASQTCETGTGASSCTSSPVDGSYADGVLTWVLPSTYAPGTSIDVGTTEVNPAATGQVVTLTLNGQPLDTDQIVGFALVPQANLLLDGVVAGVARLGPGGATVKATDVADGTYSAAIELCGGASDFGFEPTDCTVVELGDVTVAATPAA